MLTESNSESGVSLGRIIICFPHDTILFYVQLAKVDDRNGRSNLHKMDGGIIRFLYFIKFSHNKGGFVRPVKQHLKSTYSRTPDRSAMLDMRHMHLQQILSMYCPIHIYLRAMSCISR